MKAGDRVFDRQGHEYEYLQPLTLDGQDQHLARPVQEDGDGGEYLCDPVLIHDVLSRATHARVDPRMQEATRELAAIEQKIRTARAEVGRLEVECRARVAALRSRSTALARVQDFLDGRISHFVIAELSGDRWKIETFAESMPSAPEEGRWTKDRPLRLLSLYGRTAGDLSWRLGHYSDGSGWSFVAYPCTSEEEAHAVLAEKVAARIEEERKKERGGYTDVLMDTADKWGLPFPADLRVRNLSARLALAKSQAEERAGHQTTTQAQIADLTAKLAAAEVPQ